MGGGVESLVEFAAHGVVLVGAFVLVGGRVGEVGRRGGPGLQVTRALDHTILFVTVGTFSVFLESIL